MIDRSIFTQSHDLYRESVRDFVQQHVVPNRERWETVGRVDRELFSEAGKVGILGLAAPERHGGGGLDDFRYNAILSECLAENDVLSAGLGLSLQADIALPYFLDHASEEQQERWLPGIVSGKTILALAMTEPGAGSDVASIATTAVRENGGYRINGAKTFITNGLNADLIVVAVKTAPDEGHRGMSLVVVEESRSGFSRGRKLTKLGQHAADTAELFFDDVRVPEDNLLGEEGHGFYMMMTHLAQERLAVAVQAAAQAVRAYELALGYAKERRAFGAPIGSFQHNRFVLAEMKTEVEIGRTYVDKAVMDRVEGKLDAVSAAQAKWWTTEMCQRVVDRAVQIHGGYGYMAEYAVARAWVDSRVQTIYAGTTEVMKDIIGKSIGL
jgi:alkylation response protein AidB-like acyl-CoA dehydrogenase